jgi:hypothetical protein
VWGGILLTDSQGDGGLLAGAGVYSGESGEGWACGAGGGVGVWELVLQAPNKTIEYTSMAHNKTYRLYIIITNYIAINYTYFKLYYQEVFYK